MDLRTAERCEWAILTAHFPGRESEPIGILLRDVSRDELLLRMRPGWWSVLSDEDEPEVWAEFSEELERLAREMQVQDLLEWLETSASHAFQISARQEICVLDPEATLDLLYREQILREPSHQLISNSVPASLSQSEINDIVVDVFAVSSTAVRIFSGGLPAC